MYSNKYQIFFLFFFIGISIFSQNINLKVVGNKAEGFSVDIYSDNQLLVHNSEEFSLKVANLDLSETTEITAWKGAEWTGDKNLVKLSKNTYLSDFDLNLLITVTYEVINQHVVKKTVDLFQSGIPTLYFTLEETSKPAEEPLKYVTFEHDDFPGGFSHRLPVHMHSGVREEDSPPENFFHRVRSDWATAWE